VPTPTTLMIYSNVVVIQFLISKRKTPGYSNNSNLTLTPELTSTERYSNVVSPPIGGTPWSSV
jgi:hypothetical protein